MVSVVLAEHGGTDMQTAEYKGNVVDGVQTVQVTVKLDGKAQRTVNFLIGGEYDTAEKLEAEIISTFESLGGFDFVTVLKNMETRITQVIKFD